MGQVTPQKSAYGRYTPPRNKLQLCPVCGERPADTKEDLVPNWARKRIRKLGTYSGNNVPSLLMPICSNCNRAFGRLYENDAARVLGPMVDGQARSLTLEDQEVVGRWIVKSSLMFYLGRAPAGSPPDRLSLARALCRTMRKTRTVPHQSFVRIGWTDARHPDGPQVQPLLHEVGHLPETAFHGSSSLGYVAWEVAIGAPELLGSFVMACRDNDALFRVWPPQTAAREWPPAIALTTRDRYRLRLAWQCGTWPPNEATPLELGAWEYARTVDVPRDSAAQ